MSQDPDQLIELEGEDDAVAFLERALAHEFEAANLRLDFKDWPVLALHYQGEKFHGTITPDVAQVVVDVQLVLNRAYSLAVRGSSNLQGLPEDVKRELQVEVSVEDGSALVEINLGDWAEKLSKDLIGKMTGDQIVFTVVGVALVVTAAWCFKLYLKHRSEEHKADRDLKQAEADNQTRIALSAQDTQRLQLLAATMQQSAVVRAADEWAEQPRAAFLRSAIDADAVTVQGDATVTGAFARRNYRAVRRAAAEAQLNGNYTIRSFAWADDGESALVRVDSEDTFRSFTAEVSLLALTAEQQARFKDATFDKARVYLQINAKILDDEVRSARIVSVDEQPPAASR